MNTKESGKERKKRKGKGCLIAFLVVLALLLLSGGIGWAYLSREHREARTLPIRYVDFSVLKDGVYHGSYPGGVYKWRFNDCDVTVAGGRVTDIQLLNSIDTAKERPGAEMLYDRVIAAQSLQVDTISGSTLTGKGYLKCVELALAPGQN